MKHELETQGLPERKRIKTEPGSAAAGPCQQQQQQQRRRRHASEAPAAAHAARPLDNVSSGLGKHDTIDLTADSDDAEDSHGETAAAAAAAGLPAPTAAASAPAAAAGPSASGLTLGQLKSRYRTYADGSPEKCGYRGLSRLARLLAGSKSNNSVDEVLVSALLPHMEMLLQHWQQRVEAWGGQAGDARSGSSAGTPGLSPGCGVDYVKAMLLLLKQRLVVQQFAGPEQQQLVLEQLKAVLAEFDAAGKKADRERRIADRERRLAQAEAAAETEAAAAAAGVPCRVGRSRPYRVQQLCDDLTASPNPEAQQQLQLATAWAQAICKRPWPHVPHWVGQEPQSMLVREMLQRWEPLKQHVLGFNIQASKIKHTVAAAAVEQQLACVASLLQLPQVAAAAEAPLIREVQGKLQAALKALSRGCKAPNKPPQAAAVAAAAAAVAAAAEAGGDRNSTDSAGKAPEPFQEDSSSSSNNTSSSSCASWQAGNNITCRSAAATCGCSGSSRRSGSCRESIATGSSGSSSRGSLMQSFRCWHAQSERYCATWWCSSSSSSNNTSSIRSSSSSKGIAATSTTSSSSSARSADGSTCSSTATCSISSSWCQRCR